MVTQKEATHIVNAVVREERTQTKKHLVNNILHPNILATHYPIEYGKRDIHLSNDSKNLGAFDKLSLEIQHTVLGYVDVGTLPKFRCVNQKALMVLDSLQTYKKVVNSESIAVGIRLAVGKTD